MDFAAIGQSTMGVVSQSYSVVFFHLWFCLIFSDLDETQVHTESTTVVCKVGSHKMGSQDEQHAWLQDKKKVGPKSVFF